MQKNASIRSYFLLSLTFSHYPSLSTLSLSLSHLNGSNLHQRLFFWPRGGNKLLCSSPFAHRSNTCQTPFDYCYCYTTRQLATRRKTTGRSHQSSPLNNSYRCSQPSSALLRSSNTTPIPPFDRCCLPWSITTDKKGKQLREALEQPSRHHLRRFNHRRAFHHLRFPSPRYVAIGDEVKEAKRIVRKMGSFSSRFAQPPPDHLFWPPSFISFLNQMSIEDSLHWLH